MQITRGMIGALAKKVRDEQAAHKEKQQQVIEPCTHPGCSSHVTHPCEKCGQQWSPIN